MGYSAIEVAQRLGGLLVLAMNDLSAVPGMLGSLLPSAALLALMLVPMALAALGLGFGLGAGLLALTTGGLLKSRALSPAFASRGRRG